MFASTSGTLIRKTYWSLKRRGLTGSVLHAIVRPFRKTQPRWTRSPADQADDEDFDARYAVQTAGIVELKTLAVNDRAWVYGVDYEPTSESQFQRLMANLPEDVSDYTFIDFGSGKGKALLLAAGHGFGRVIGLEISEQLHAIAERNIRSYTGPKLTTRIESICTDAAKFALPAGPLVLYFYNPFERPVMERVLRKIRRALEAEPRPVYAALTYPRLLDLFKDAGFQPVHEEDGCCLLRART